MNTNEYAAIQQTIRQERLEHTISLAEGIADFLLDAYRYFGSKIVKTGEKLDQISPYLPRSQA